MSMECKMSKGRERERAQSNKKTYAHSVWKAGSYGTLLVKTSRRRRRAGTEKRCTWLKIHWWKKSTFQTCTLLECKPSTWFGHFNSVFCVLARTTIFLLFFLYQYKLYNCFQLPCVYASLKNNHQKELKIAMNLETVSIDVSWLISQFSLSKSKFAMFEQSPHEKLAKNNAKFSSFCLFSMHLILIKQKV